MAFAKTEEFPDRLVALSRFARALGHPARIAVLVYLREHGETACMDIVRRIPLSQPAVSRHLAELRHAGLVAARSSGAEVFYSLQHDLVRDCCEQLGETLVPRQTG